MKQVLFVLATLLASCQTPAYAQEAAPSSMEWYKLGSPFGKNKAWQFGLDTSLMPAGGCVQRELHDGQWLAGPCRDIFLLAKAQDDGSFRSIFHLGAYAMANAQRVNWSYGPRFGVNAGQVVKLGLVKIIDNVPYLEALADLHLPKFMQYADKVLTFDYGVAYRPVHDSSVNGNWTHGPMVKLDLPFSDVVGLLKTGL